MSKELKIFNFILNKKGFDMSIIFYIIGYIVLSIAVSYFLKSRKYKVKERNIEINSYIKTKQVENKIFDRKKHNDYMNDPKFSYMSCNRYNSESSFYKEQKSNRVKRCELVEESKHNKLDNIFYSSYSINSSNADCAGSLGGTFNPNSTLLSRHWN